MARMDWIDSVVYPISRKITLRLPSSTTYHLYSQLPCWHSPPRARQPCQPRPHRARRVHAGPRAPATPLCHPPSSDHQVSVPPCPSPPYPGSSPRLQPQRDRHMSDQKQSYPGSSMGTWEGGAWACGAGAAAQRPFAAWRAVRVRRQPAEVGWLEAKSAVWQRREKRRCAWKGSDGAKQRPDRRDDQ